MSTFGGGGEQQQARESEKKGRRRMMKRKDIFKTREWSIVFVKIPCTGPLFD